ncbi:hypothetical protein ATEIFO6365_0004091100 [Aspergillus terreus]|uniref:Uncharacterized protein n=1 Tax=Aspergillus terreus TaxID=33178 RepID=A0A5M3YQH5_ASPTE|nr:hypothetical protein ATETN484_0002093600 [Aspergillus terreus]GFF15792.1 hypothetical protein ATEIFO6365_0004091100 [Aspergillus terreus]
MRLPTIYAHRNGGLTVTDALDTIEQIYKDSKVIIFGCLASWTIYHLRLGVVGLILLLAVCRTYYELSLRRVERAIRDETRRYHAKDVLRRGESVEWMNRILVRLWHLYQQRICDHIVRYVNHGLAGRPDPPGAEGESPAPKVVIQSLALVEQPIRILHIRTYTRPESGNFVIEGTFRVDLAPPPDHHHRRPLRTREPLVDLVIVHDKQQDRRQNDIAVQVRQFTGTGLVRLEIDFQGDEPHILQPQIELQGQPQIDCTYRSVSQHHFPFHFAHHIDWRKMVEVQIREGLGWAFHRPLPLLHLLGGRLLIRMMTWWWMLKRACHD